uniref:Uncharacterized protein n=1 Tax=Pithovirus LCDPAC02 TaxID=2506601 RepID=A0A481YRM5_9VIRU|nr:MAG: hypothetical protein LCDPAC02_03150 [Pithovirus LCDPAC02]
MSGIENEFGLGSGSFSIKDKYLFDLCNKINDLFCSLDIKNNKIEGFYIITKIEIEFIVLYVRELM